MKNTLLVFVGVMMTAISALAAATFTAPTAEQLKAAANNPAAIEALLVGATPEQAAQVIKAVVVKIVSMGLGAAKQDVCIRSVIKAAFSAIPAGSAPLLAASLGTACGSSVAIRGNPAVVSSIQTAVATQGGSGGSAMAIIFGEAYTNAKASNEAGHNDVLDNAPPVAKAYPAQQ